MVVIRLARGGAKKAPFYHVVAADKRCARDGRYIENLGYFNPVARGQAVRLEINKERLDHWLSQGAQPSDRVVSLIKQYNKGMTAAIPHAPKSKKAAPKAEEATAEAEAPAAAEGEATAE